MIPAFTLFIAVVLYRVLAAYLGAEHSWLWNFSPVAAIALCGPIIFPKRIAFILPLAILLASDTLLNASFGAALVTGEMIARYVALGVVALLGLRLRECRKIWVFLSASVAGSTGFYLFTNSFSWISEPGYAKTLTGWVQALTMGLPGYPPTWFFFRNSLISDACFTVLILGALAISSASRRIAPPALGSSNATV